MQIFPKSQYEILEYLFSYKNDDISFDELERELNLPSTLIYGDCLTLQDMDLINIKEDRRKEIIWKGFDDDHKDLAELPERTIIKALRKMQRDASVSEIDDVIKLGSRLIGKTLRILELKGWAIIKKGKISIADSIKESEPDKTEDEKLMEILLSKGSIYDTDTHIAGINLEESLNLLKPRNKWFSVKQRKLRYARLTKEGSKIIRKGIKKRDTVTYLTPNLLIDERWREVDFKEYNVSDISDPIPLGKLHPMTKVVNNVRKIFVEMGFREIRYTNVESAFWDFDALFQPQDHPAREMQDTFYLRNPNSCNLPDKSIIERIKEVHETGSDTGSKGWRYKWDIEKSKRAILRTHTTAATIRALHENPEPPGKVFLVGKVFRRETIDYKHLPFFHQVDGIIIDEEANFQNLLGTLDLFYRKMGFSRFYFRPAFFPYTEPSVEIYVYNPKKNDWMEMGGAGIFRKEVTQPLGCRVPVLAWGLGLERIAMFKYNVEYIKDLYISDIEWLKEVTACR